MTQGRYLTNIGHPGPRIMLSQNLPATWCHANGRQ
jgi:hypothetical protein